MKNTTKKMKKTYISPSVEIIRLTPANIIATSNIGVSGETDEDARSREFWGMTILDDSNENTSDNDTKF